jgi:hypothetical protein
MPNLDVSEVLFDPDLADTFDVRRRSEVVGDDGRPSIGERTFPRIVGVITPEPPADLVRRDDGQMTTHKISVVTMFRLRSASEGSQPDQVLYGGATYTVTTVLPFSRFGKGFTEAIATLMAASAPVEL